jgi:type I restriction enzyme M protein
MKKFHSSISTIGQQHGGVRKQPTARQRQPWKCSPRAKRDKVNLLIFWLKDEALEESANLPAPEVIAADITADLEAALEQFATIAEDLKTPKT